MESEPMKFYNYFMQRSYMMPMLSSTSIALNTITVRKLENHSHCESYVYWTVLHLDS